MTFSNHLLLAGAVLALAAPLCAQDCAGDIQTAPDFITVHIDDLGSFFLDPLLNDPVPPTSSVTAIEGLPPCLYANPLLFPAGFVWIASVDTENPEACCGVHDFTYFYGEGDEACFEVGQITILCETPKADCSLITLEPGPIQDANGDGTVFIVDTVCAPVCSGAITTVEAPYSNLNTYTWSIQGGTLLGALQNPATVEVEWGAAGQGSISVTVDGPNGTEVLQECVDIGQAPTADFNAPSPVCLETGVQFTSLSTPGADHSWDFGDGTFSNAVNPIHAFTNPGAYTVSLTVTTPLLNDAGDTVCCCQDTHFMDIEVLNQPGPDIECVSTLCEGDSACYWTTAGCAGANYLWTVTDANGDPVDIDGQGSPEICLLWEQGPFGTISLQIDNCSDVCDQATTVQVPIISSEATISGPDIVCEGEAAIYSVPKWMDVEYDWTVIGAQSFTQNGNQVSVVWGGTGTGTIAVEYESPFLLGLQEHERPDCSGSGVIQVNVLPELVLTNAPTQVCAGQSLFFAASWGDVTWSVDPTATVNASGASCTVTFNAPGTYVVSAAPLNPNDFCNDIVTTTVLVTELAAPIINGPTEGCPIVPQLYTIDNPEPGVTYIWSPGAAGSVLSSAGSSATVAWDSTFTNPILTVYAQSPAPLFCTTSSNLSFTVLAPADPTGLVQGTACENQIMGYDLITSQPLNGEDVQWSINPSTAGSVVAGQGTGQVDIQWNDYVGPAELTVTTSLCERTRTETFEINVNGEPIVVPIQTGHLCPGAFNPATLFTNPNDPGFTYEWTGPGGTNLGSAASITVVDPGIHEVLVTNTLGCQSTRFIDVTPDPVPDADITSPNPFNFCPQDTGLVEMYTPTSGNWTHQWTEYGSSTVISTNSFLFHDLTANGSGVFAYEVTTADATTGCAATDFYSFSVLDTCTSTGGNCIPIEQLDPSATVNCNTATIDVGSLFASNISYDYGDGTTGGADTHTYLEAGCYNISIAADVPNTLNPTSTCTVYGNVGVCIPLAALFTYDIINCSTVIFEDLSSYILDNPANAITDWYWDFGDGNTSTVPSPTHNYAGGGTYTVKLIVTAAGINCTAIFTQNVVIGSVGLPTITLEDPVCVGEPAEHSATAINAISYGWTFPDGVAFDGPIIEHTFTSVPTGNTISVTATDINGCTQTSTASITVNPAPGDALTPDVQLICPLPGNTTIQATPGFDTYQWYDAGGILTGETQDFLTAGPGSYSVEVTNAFGCSNTSGPVDVQLLPEISPAITGPTLICGSGPAEFSLPGPYSNIKWLSDNGSGPMSTVSPTLTLNGNPGDVYSVTALFTDQNGCNQSSLTLVVEWAEEVQFNLTSPNDPACAGDAILIEVNPVQPGVNYNWSTGDTGADIVVYNAGVYSATGINAQGCSHTATFEVNPAPDLCMVPTGCYENCGPDSLCAPEGYQTYTWFLNMDAIQSGSDPCILAEESGIYNVLVEDDNGCSSTSEDLEFTLLDCECDIEAILTPLDDCCVSLSFDNNSTGVVDHLLVESPQEPATFLPGPDFDLLIMEPDYVKLEYPGGLPAGPTDDAIVVCFDAPGTHVVGWQWTGPNGELCSDEMTFTCGGDTVPPDSTCLTIIENNVECLDEGVWAYSFTLCNGNATPFDIGYFTLAPTIPAGLQIDQTVFDLSASPIAPGNCQDIEVILTGDPNAQDGCFFISAHEADPALGPSVACCYEEHCFELPPCNTPPQDCATPVLLDFGCTADGGYVLEIGFSNHTGYTFGDVQFTYPGQNGTLLQWISGISIDPFTSGIVGIELGPDILYDNPFCMDIIFFEENPGSSLLECCHISWCVDLPPCGDIPGCTDPAAVNYNPDATIDDGSCYYEDCFGPSDPDFPCISVFDPVCGCDNVTYANPCIAETNFGIQFWTPGPCGFQEVEGCTDPSALNYNPDATIDDGSCLYENDCYGPIEPNFPCTDEWDPVCGCDGFTYPNACYAEAYAGLLYWTAGACDEGGPVLGCTDPDACNFQPEAVEELGICNYPESGYDCFGNCINDANGNGICDEAEIGEGEAGCTDPAALNYIESATEDDGSCVYDTCVQPGLIEPNFPCTEEYNPVCGCDGMTYANACYAMHFGGVISWSPGACDGDPTGPPADSCPTDINGDGTTTVADLLMVLGEFSNACE